MSGGSIALGDGSGHARGEDWRKSSFSLANTHCVTVARLADGSVAVRDSQATSGPVLQVRPKAWMAFTAGFRRR
jgi:hypothetical protein